MKVRIKFSKSGAMKFVGHLDMMRYFQKAIRRAGIDIAYSGGYSPHQIMSFAAPLGVGLTSNGEYFDIEMNSFTTEDDIQDNLNRVMADGISILKVTKLSDTTKNAMASVAAASYKITFVDYEVDKTDWVGRLNAFYMRPEIPAFKKSKRSTIELDIKPLIYKLEIQENVIFMMLNASSSGNIKPGFVMEVFFESIGEALPEFALQISREETYGNLGTEEQPIFVPLSDVVS